jgi:hypothetical protein
MEQPLYRLGQPSEIGTLYAWLYEPRNAQKTTQKLALETGLWVAIAKAHLRNHKNKNDAPTYFLTSFFGYFLRCSAVFPSCRALVFEIPKEGPHANPMQRNYDKRDLKIETRNEKKNDSNTRFVPQRSFVFFFVIFEIFCPNKYEICNPGTFFASEKPTKSDAIVQKATPLWA